MARGLHYEYISNLPFPKFELSIGGIALASDTPLRVLIAEDDDGGTGYNSKIAADLRPGEYFVQIRHYNTAAGTGDYSIKVSK